MATEVIGDSYASSAGPWGLYDKLHWYTVGLFDKYGDPRVSQYNMMRTPWPTVAITLAYLWFVKQAGPRMMRNRKSYQIVPLVRVYSLAMTIWCTMGFYAATQLVNYGLDVIGCRPVDPNQRDKKTLEQIYYGWMFYCSRLVELADTVFFVLRKKDSQVTDFHVFHHASVPTAVWMFLKFAPGGNSGIFPFINTAVHSIMYCYYFLSTFPSMRPYLGWKKYLTQLQIVQFLIIIACCMQPLFIPGCKFPRAGLLVIIGFSLIFIYLFVDFYLKAYRKNAAHKAAAKQALMEQEEDERRKQQQLHQQLSTSNAYHSSDNNNQSTSQDRFVPTKLKYKQPNGTRNGLSCGNGTGNSKKQQ